MSTFFMLIGGVSKRRARCYYKSIISDHPKRSTIRVVTLEGNPWFVATDACKIMYDMNGSNASHYTKHLDEGEMLRGNRIPGQRGFPPLLISESGLYKLVMRSDKPQAKAFQDWVTKEVLPSIRKTGTYSLHQRVAEQACTVAPRQLPLVEKPKEVPVGDRLEANPPFLLPKTAT